MDDAQWYLDDFYHLVKGWEPPAFRFVDTSGDFSVGPGEKLLFVGSHKKVGRLVAGLNDGDAGLPFTTYKDRTFGFSVRFLGRKETILEDSFGFQDAVGTGDYYYYVRQTDWTQGGGGSGTYTDTATVTYSAADGFVETITRTGTEPVGAATLSHTYSNLIDDAAREVLWGLFEGAVLSPEHYSSGIGGRGFSSDGVEKAATWESRARYVVVVDSISNDDWDGIYENLTEISAEWDEWEFDNTLNNSTLASVSYENILTAAESEYSDHGMLADYDLGSLPWVMADSSGGFRSGASMTGLVDKSSTQAPRQLALDEMAMTFREFIDHTGYGVLIYEAVGSVSLDIVIPWEDMGSPTGLTVTTNTIVVTITPGERVTDFTAQVTAILETIIADPNFYQWGDPYGEVFAHIKFSDSDTSNAGLVGKAITKRNRGYFSGGNYYKTYVKTATGTANVGFVIKVEEDLTVPPFGIWTKKTVTYTDARGGTRVLKSDTPTVVSQTASSTTITGTTDFLLKAGPGKKKVLDAETLILGDGVNSRKFLDGGLAPPSGTP